MYVEEMTHIACIPAGPGGDNSLMAIFFDLWPAQDWEEDRGIAVSGLGLIKHETRKHLGESAAYVIARFEAIVSADASVLRYGAFLVMLLRQAVDRMNHLPGVATRAIAVAAHIQRVALELEGLSTYLQVVLPRMQSPDDFSHSVLDVVGGFVREGAVTQTWHRVGIPYWVLQPLTSAVAVWKVVQESPLPWSLSSTVCDPPILHRSGSFVGVSNLTGNWISSMVVSVSKHVVSSHLRHLSLASIPEVPESDSLSNKRPRIEERTLVTKHLTLHAAEAVLDRSKPSRRRRKRRQEGNGPKENAQGSELAPVGSSLVGQSSQASPSPAQSASAGFLHPSRCLVPSPFVNVADVWADALRAASPVPQTPNSAVYFFPPPYLLDTVVAADLPPPGCAYPDRMRVDTKVDRYLHNLLRIREFCRTRLFDVSLDNRPLTISEWRAALWGDYLPQTSVRAGGEGADARRAKRRLGERNGIGALFHRVAHMDSYDPHAVVEYRDLAVDLNMVAKNPAIRGALLWEAHEVNFRSELLALDTLLVHKKDWMEIHRWEREMQVSGVWGRPSSAATAAAPTSPESDVFCWYTPPHEKWETCRERLRAFTRVLMRWPDCPECVVQAPKGDLLEDEYRQVQREAVTFYVQTFISQYRRLPIVPIEAQGF